MYVWISHIIARINNCGYNTHPVAKGTHIFLSAFFCIYFFLIYFCDSTSLGGPLLVRGQCVSNTPQYLHFWMRLQTQTCLLFTLNFHCKVIDQWLLDFSCTLAYTAKIFQSNASEQTLYSHTRTHETAHSSLAPWQKTISGEVFQ